MGSWASACRLPSLTARQLGLSNSPRGSRSQMGHQTAAMASAGTPAAAAATPAAAREPAGAAAAVLVWFRNDLRLADHEGLHAAALQLQQQQQQHMLQDIPAAQPPLLLPFYCLDERELQAAGALQLPRLGPHRLRLLLEACHALREALQSHGSDLLWVQGRPESVVGRLVALAAAAGSTHVSLHHYMQPGRASAELEDGVAAAFSTAAAAHGLPSSVRRFWGCTLYHPDDLPYRLFGAADGDSLGGSHCASSNKASAAEEVTSSSSSSSSSTAAAAAAEEEEVRDAKHSQQQAAQQQASQDQQQDAATLGKRSWPNQQQGRFACLPLVMSDFRRVLQAHTSVRSPLPAPQAAPSSSSGAGSSSSSESSDTPVLPLLPAALAAAATAAGLLAPIPTQLPAVYAAAGADGEAAVARWEELTGQRCAELAPAGSGLHDARSAVPFSMGEERALLRLRYYLGLQASDGHRTRPAGQAAPINGYQESRMQAAGVDSSAKLSAFLSLGCLSPRTVFHEVSRLAAAEAAGAACEAADAAGTACEVQQALSWREPQRGDTWRWLLMHLAIRDFFTYSALKEGDALEKREGFSEKHVEWKHDPALLLSWTRGMTGLPFVDACMRELAATGFTSNRGRQNVANFLSKTLGVDWRWGAEYFECLLADADWAVNRGNWAYNTGTGADPRDRRFCTVSQGLRYDADAALVRAWVPQLAGLHSPELVHQPWEAPPEALAAAGVRLRDAGPAPPLAAGEPTCAEQQQQHQQQLQQQPAAKGGEGAPIAAAAAAAAAQGVDTRASAATAASAVAVSGGLWYPLPIVDASTQLAKGPKQKQPPQRGSRQQQQQQQRRGSRQQQQQQQR